MCSNIFVNLGFISLLPECVKETKLCALMLEYMQDLHSLWTLLLKGSLSDFKPQILPSALSHNLKIRRTKKCFFFVFLKSVVAWKDIDYAYRCHGWSKVSSHPRIRSFHYYQSWQTAGRRYLKVRKIDSHWCAMEEGWLCLPFTSVPPTDLKQNSLLSWHLHRAPKDLTCRIL